MFLLIIIVKSTIDVGGSSLALDELCLLGYQIMTNLFWHEFWPQEWPFNQFKQIQLEPARKIPDTQEDYPSKCEGKPAIRESKVEKRKRGGIRGKMFHNFLVAASREASCLDFMS